MIGKIKVNHSFAETTGYVLNKEKARLLGGTLAGTDSAIISREFLLSRDINPGIKRPVYHLMQSYSYDDRDTQNLTDDKLLELATKHFAGIVLTAKEPELLKKEGLLTYRRRVDEFIETELSEYQFFVARHEDVEHTHTHLVASRINVRDGRCVPTYLERHRNQLICRELEKDFDLERVPNSWEVDTRKPNRGWSKGTKAGDKVEVQTRLQNAIDQVTQGATEMTFEEFTERLLAKGVEVRRTQHEQQIGLSYKMNGTAMKASKLGKRYTYPGLQSQSVDDAIRRHAIQQINYTNRIAPQVIALWNRETMNRPNLTEVTFKDYQIRLSDTGQPEVYKGDLKLLEANETGYQSYGLTETDCEAIQRMDTLSTRQAKKRHLDAQMQAQMQAQAMQAAIAHLEPELTQEQILDRDYTQLAERVGVEALSELSIRDIDPRVDEMLNAVDVKPLGGEPGEKHVTETEVSKLLEEIEQAHSVDRLPSIPLTTGETVHQTPGDISELGEGSGGTELPGTEPTQGSEVPNPHSSHENVKQRQATDLLVRRVRNIWIREKKGRPNLTVVPFEDYQIRAVEGQIHLYKGDLKILEANETRYQSYSLTETDCDAIQRFNALSQAQAEERKTLPPDVLTQQMKAQDHYDRLATLVRAEAKAGQHLSITDVDNTINLKIRADHSQNVDQLVFATIGRSPATQRLKHQEGQEVAREYVASIVGQLIVQTTPVKTPPKPPRGGEGR